MTPQFSIITPIHIWKPERLEKFKKTIASIENQTFQDFEWIIINDGSPMDVEPLWRDLANKGAVMIHKEHEERVAGYNAGMAAAKGKWICFLDSDDEYSLDYLEELNKMIHRFPVYKMFNFGVIYDNPDGTITKRKAFRPKFKKTGHEKFGGGTIVNGAFAFSREIYLNMGGFPPTHIHDIDCSEINYSKGPRDLFMGTPYDFSAYAQMEFPELRELFMVPENDPLKPDKIIKELGNPWGQDFYLFYKYTRKYHSMPFEKYLLIVHPKAIGEL